MHGEMEYYRYSHEHFLLFISPMNHIMKFISTRYPEKYIVSRAVYSEYKKIESVVNVKE